MHRVDVGEVLRLVLDGLIDKVQEARLTGFPGRPLEHDFHVSADIGFPGGKHFVEQVDETLEGQLKAALDEFKQGWV